MGALNKITIKQGHVLEVLAKMPDESVHACVTDPPYELGFMGKTWDKSGIAYNIEVWREVLRVLKPGAHLLAFGGSRTYHRLACAIEDAGFEIRDQIMWLYGSGFPKSLDISKGIDKAAGVEREIIGLNPNDRQRRDNNLSDYGLQGGVGKGNITIPSSSEAGQWQGWGTALKPAHEPIVVARKPLKGTVVNNVLKHGCGGLNIDGCRVETNNRPNRIKTADMGNENANIFHGRGSGWAVGETTLGRWPANVIHDGSEEVLAEFGKYGEREVSGTAKKGKINVVKRQTGMFGGRGGGTLHNDTGSAARFFYCAKASSAERGNNNRHPTVKPLTLMRYLCRLVTPPEGIILDCFSGSGSALIAAAQEGFEAVGIDIDPEYCNMAAKRLKSALGLLAAVEVE